MSSVRFIAALCLFCVCWIGSTSAQQSPAQEQPTEVPRSEGIEIGLSTDRIAITSDFSGADLTIFGAVDNADPLLQRQGRYDVIVVLEGPARPVVVWRKSRILGVWINAESETFLNVPVSYSIATTRAIQDIAAPATYRQLSLGTNYIYLQPADKIEGAGTIEEFTAALRERKKATGLYSERIGGVQFLSQSLFRATVRLAPNIPVGTHRARAFLFRNGVFIKETSASLAILKSGFEQSVHQAARQQSVLYGVFAVVLAMVTGWLGRVVFRKD